MNNTLQLHPTVRLQQQVTPEHTSCKIKPAFWLFLLLLTYGSVKAQTASFNKNSFFSDETVLEMTLATDYKKLMKGKFKTGGQRISQPASISFNLADSISITGSAELTLRGKTRRAECNMAPVFINLKNSGTNVLKKLGKLKLVWPCNSDATSEQLVLKEFLVYKIYQLITEKSFRVRLVKMTLNDSSGKSKPKLFHAFFIEDVDDMAKRINCAEVNKIKYYTEQTNRQQTTLVNLFEYMIGNTDWGIPVYHNIKLLRSKKDSTFAPYAIPYDFDYCGLVNADYAVPPPDFGIESVRDRLYRGFPRTMEELQAAIKIFLANRNKIDLLIMNLDPLSKANKNEMLQYLGEFYEIISSEKRIKKIFIDNARTE